VLHKSTLPTLYKHPTKRYTQHVQMQLTAAAAMTLAQATGLLQL